MNAAGLPITSSALAFDSIAHKYDEIFTRSLVGRLQREIVWEAISKIYVAGQSILELNCGTGEDALFLARRGVSVVACDASQRMIAVARQRKTKEMPSAQIDFRLLPSESLDSLRGDKRFDGVLSNFSGLNCVTDLGKVASTLGDLVKPGGRALLCMSTRVCLWEIGWFLSHGNVRKALRRVRGKAVARLEGVEVSVLYPTRATIRRAFEPAFRLVGSRAIGLLIPPSYLEMWATRHRAALAVLQRMDRGLRDFPILRQFGDHVLFDFERVSL